MYNYCFRSTSDYVVPSPSQSTPRSDPSHIAPRACGGAIPPDPPMIPTSLGLVEKALQKYHEFD
jgi:hypothetical protein